METLDDIIARNKAKNRAQNAGRGARRGGGTQNGGGFKSAPGGFRPAVPTGLAREINANKRVRINISNLANSVRTRDLEELFMNYGIEFAAVNYGEGGQPLGTGDIVLSKRDAHRVLNDFFGVTVDQQKLHMVLVEDNSIPTDSIFNRVKLVGGGVQQRRPAPGPRHQPYQQQQRRGGAAGGARGGSRGGRGGRVEKKPRSAADLDAELDAYMRKGSAV